MTGTLTDTLTHRQLLRRPFRQTHRHETRIRQTHRQGHRHMQPSSFWGVTRAYVSNLVKVYRIGYAIDHILPIFILWWTAIQQWTIIMLLMGRSNYFNGHFPWLGGCSPEGMIKQSLIAGCDGNLGFICGIRGFGSCARAHEQGWAGSVELR